MKYKVGDKVRIVHDRSNYMNVSMGCYLGTIMTIAKVRVNSYIMIEDNGTWLWDDSCIEGLVEELTHFPKDTNAKKLGLDLSKKYIVVEDGDYFKTGDIVNIVEEYSSIPFCTLVSDITKKKRPAYLYKLWHYEEASVDKLEPDPFNGFVQYPDGTKCKIIGDHNQHHVKIGSIITVTPCNGKNSNGFAYSSDKHGSITFRSIDLELVESTKEETQDDIRVGDIVKYEKGLNICRVDSINNGTAKIKCIRTNYGYACSLNTLCSVTLKDVKSFEEHYKLKCIVDCDGLLLCDDNNIVTNISIKEKTNTSDTPVCDKEPSIDKLNKSKFKIGDTVQTEIGQVGYITNVKISDSIKERFTYRIAGLDGVFTEDYLTKVEFRTTTDTGMPSGIIKPTLNTKPKTNMGNIEQVNNTIETEKYFSDDKNLKAITKLDNELKELIKLLDKASSDIRIKYEKLSSNKRNLNASFQDRDLNNIKTILEYNKDILEFMNTYTKNTVEDLGKDTSEKIIFDVTKFFN